MSFYSAAMGAGQQQDRMGVHANNIANVNTNGFKAGRPSFAALMYGNVTGIGGAQLPRGSGTRMVMAETDMGAGAMSGSALPQSYAIMGSGFFGLVEPNTGEISYTRDGAFSLSEIVEVDENGLPQRAFYLSDGEGRLVLGNTGAPIQVKDEYAEQPVGVFDFINVNGMRHVGGNRFQPVEKNGQVMLGSGAVERGMLERSNTELTIELTKVIEAQRSYTYALKMIQTSDELESTVNGLRG